MFDKLIEAFLKFPGIGPRQAKRFVYFLAGQDEKFLKNLAGLFLEIKKDIKQCDSCFRFFSKPGFDAKKPAFRCEICSDINREKNLLMVVEKDVDLENIEKSRAYNGKYFVLGGMLSLNGKNRLSSPRFKELFNKTGKERPKEIIIATSATIEGENTARYAEKILEPLAKKFQLKVSRLGRGLSTGTELEFIDSETMTNALRNRQ
ncbi:MAG: toprim domain-containing protein [Patescibacteria group bacterium]